MFNDDLFKLVAGSMSKIVRQLSATLNILNMSEISNKMYFFLAFLTEKTSVKKSLEGVP